MTHSHIQKVLNVWKTKNKITNAVKTDLYFEIIEQMADLFAAGSYYYYIFDFEKLEMEFVHNDTKHVLGIEAEKFTLQNLSSIIHPEDIKKMHEKDIKAADFLLNRISKEEIPFY